MDSSDKYFSTVVAFNDAGLFKAAYSDGFKVCLLNAINTESNIYQKPSGIWLEWLNSMSIIRHIHLNYWHK